MSDDCISTDRLCKTFGDVRAVNNVSLHVKSGEIYGFLGLNGAGKTTTIRMLLGMVSPASGRAYLFGSEVGRRSPHLWNRIGYLVETPYSYGELTVRENLEIFRRLRSVDNPNSVAAMLSLLRLEEYADRRAGNLSLGNAQRLGLAKALLHEPEMLILDEPANGLDPEGIVEIRELLKRLAAEKGVTVFISSHILGEISKFADRIGIIHNGALLREWDTDRLQAELRRRLVVSSRDNDKAASILREKGFDFHTTEGGSLATGDAGAIRNPDRVAAILSESGCPPMMLNVEEEDLESYFLRVVGGDAAGSVPA